jgi:hypothetical protein
MPKTLRPIDDDFFDTAALVVPVTFDLPNSPKQVWAALASDEMGSWMGILDRAQWVSPRPLGPGPRRTVRLLRLITLHEDWYTWNEPHRAAFRVDAISIPVVSGWAEDFQLGPLPDGGTRMTYRMALESRLLRFVKIPKRWQPAINRYNEQLLGKIRTILPAPE